MKPTQDLVITGGTYKGQKITAPGGKTHPMGERERLAIMNSITPYLDGAEVVDFYAGSGALGIEAISRGAKKVTFVEKDSKAYRTILSNLKKLGIENAEVILSDAKSAKVSGDVIILDPPKFADTAAQREKAARGYKDMNLLAMKLLRPAA